MLDFRSEDCELQVIEEVQNTRDRKILARHSRNNGTQVGAPSPICLKFS